MAGECPGSGAGTGRIEFAFRLARGTFTLDAAAAVDRRGISGIFGPSGSGKTTLLRCIAGLDRAASGRLIVDGEAWENTGRGLWLAPEKRRVGYVFQEPRLFPHLNVRRNLEYGRRRGSGPAPIPFDTVVGILGIGPLLGRRPAELSGGEAQRVAIGRAMLRAPRMLLMDEPVAALDPERRQEVLPFIQKLHAESGIPVLYVTHSIDELCQLCDQLLLVDAGRVAAAGELQSLLAQSTHPLLAGELAGVLLDARIAGYDANDDLCRIDTAAGRLLVPGRGLPGDHVRLRIRAGDVSVCRESPVDSSILNRLPVTVAELRPESTHSVLLALDAAGDVLLARITRRSARELGIRPGDRLIAQIKAVSVRHARFT